MNQGFFALLSVTIRPGCGGTCKLSAQCHSPKMPVTGKGRKKILIIAEAPGQQEDERNTQLIGAAGQVLREALKTYGIDLDRDCRKTNAIRCRPPKNRKPTSTEIRACAPHIWEEIKTFKPKLIILLGQTALDSFLLNRTAKPPGAISRWRGFTIPDRKADAWIISTFHPSYVMRMQHVHHGKSEEAKFFYKDIKAGLKKIGTPFPYLPKPIIKFRFPDWVFKKKKIAFDYETNGLRPWKIPNPRIVCCSASDGKQANAFPMDSRQKMERWQRVLRSPRIKKIAHNIKFEHQWGQYFLGVETDGWLWDSMLAAHMVDNRKGVTGLKIQAYLILGVDDWSIGVTVGGEDVSKKLLEYNALDSFYTYWLAYHQMRMFK